MIIRKLSLLFSFALFCLSSFSQTTLTYKHIGVGNSSNVLSGSSFLQYDNGFLIMGSTLDNYLTFHNSSGTGHMQYDATGRFAWWTPELGTRKMILTNSGRLKIGPYYTVSGVDEGANYKVQVDGGGLFRGQLQSKRDLANADLTASSIYNGSYNYYRLNGAVSTQAYHSAQENFFTGQGGTISGYQSAAQKNTTFLNGQTYTDMGAGHIWSVQTNTFYPTGSIATKFINTYVRTQLGTNNTIGTYYSLFIESPFGGALSQISNYWGLYQESAAAKNFLAGKVGIGTSNMSDTNFNLFVEKGIRTRKVKVDMAAWPDYVFDSTYHLPSLNEVEAFIRLNKHLPGVISAKEVEIQGLDLGDNQATLLKKIEELTLYMIELQKQVEAQKREIEALKNK